MIDEWGGTLTLTEASSRELMRVLKEQDDEFMDNLFNGKCGFTLTCTDGRSVELVPTADRKTEPEIDGAIDEARFKAHCMNCQRDVADIKCLDCDGDKYFIKDEPQTDCSWK